MKVLIFDQGEMLGGAERYILDFLKELSPSEVKRYGITVYSAGWTPYLQNIPPLVQKKTFSFPSFKGNAVKKMFSGLEMLCAAWNMAGILQKEEVDTILTNTPRTSLLMWLTKTLFFWKIKPVRWVCVVHDFTTQKQIWKHLHIALRKRMFASVDGIICVSVLTSKRVKAFLQSKDYNKLRLIENGLPVSTLPEPKMMKQPKKFLMVGRIDPRKGQKLFVEGISALIKQNKVDISDFSFAIAGSSTPKDIVTVEYEQEIREFCEQNTVPVQFLGEIADVFTLYNEYDVIVVLPTEPETFGRVVIEAFAMQKMVLVAPMDGPLQIVEQYAGFIGMDKHLFLLENSTPKAFAKKVKELQLQQNLLPHAVKRGREFVEHFFNLSETKRQMIRILESS